LKGSLSQVTQFNNKTQFDIVFIDFVFVDSKIETLLCKINANHRVTIIELADSEESGQSLAQFLITALCYSLRPLREQFEPLNQCVNDGGDPVEPQAQG
jgi:hypothetical protein